MRTKRNILGLLLLVLVCGSGVAAASIASTSGNVIYIDSSGNVNPKLLGNYVSYTVTNDTASNIADAWVTIGDFAGGNLKLGLHEPGRTHIGPLAVGASRAVFFYVNSDCSAYSAGQCNPPSAQTFSVKLYSGPPSASPVQSQSFSVTIQETTAAQANKVNTVVTSTTDPILGSLITVTVTGATGTIGSAKTFYASPQTTYDFPADAFRLYSTSVTFSGANAGTYNNQLLIPTSAFPSTASTNYTFVATYLVVGTTGTSTPVSPVAFISSGTQIKHTDTSSFVDFPPISPASSTLTLQKLESASSLPTGGTVTYTLQITNAGSSDATVDQFVDTLPNSPASATYVFGSSKFAGSTIADPAISGNTLTWSGIFPAPQTSTGELTFQVNVPNTQGTYTNSAYALVSSTQIDTTLDASDNSPATVSLGVGTPILSVTSTHTGNFTQGQTGATYTLTVSNTGSGATSGTVTITDTLPSGLTATSMSGSGWTCTLATLTCTRTDALAGGASYPAITLTVNVGANAAASVTNSVTASGGGATNSASATDTTAITQLPVLAVTSTHTGNFTQGQTGATYTLTVSNTGSGATSGTVTINDTLPSGLTATSMSGSGWTCTLATLTCTRTDALAGGASYPAITLTVNVASNAAASVTNSVTASGGGATNSASVTDTTTITQLPVLAVTSTHTGNFTQGQTGATYTLTVSNTGSGATSGTVTITDTLPSGLTATSMSGSGWTCTLATLTCTRTDALAGGASYPAITLTVNVASNAAASVTNSVTASGGGATNSASATDTTAITQLPVLAVTSTHTGNFTQGQTGATYTLTVSNTGSGATSGTVTITDTLPSGLTATSMSGSGWTCTLATLTCTRTDALAGGASYPAITLTVNVASNAAASVTNSVTASGGGATNSASATDTTAITQLPVLAVTSTHTGNFTQGQTGATYTLTVSNTGSGATSGTVTITDTLPSGLTATSMSGSGWTCTLATLTCTRTDALAGGASYPAITLTVNVASNAAASVTNSVTASGGGATNSASATDTTAITQLPVLAVTSTHTGNFIQGQTGATYTLTVSNTGSGATSGTVTITDTLPSGLTATSMSGSGWTCTLATLTCTRTDALAGGASYPAITLTVNVAKHAPSSLTNAATANGGGAVEEASASDVTTVNAPIAAPTTTTLVLSPGNSVNVGTPVTLTATVLSSGVAVYPGVVDFCDANAASCTGSALLGTAQLNAGGNASARIELGIGTYSVKAVFEATAANLGSESAPQNLVVGSTGGYPSTTTISYTGSNGTYNFTGTVTAFGRPMPTGTVSFLDTLNGGSAVASAPLDPSTLGYVVAPALNASSVSGLPYWLASADFNNDGILDVVAPAGNSNSVTVMLGNGDGSFKTPSSYSTEPNSFAYAVAVGDFNSDGNVDLVVTNTEGAPSISVLLGNGDGTFQSQVSYAVGNNPMTIAVGDIDGDGIADLAVVNHDDATVSVLLGNADGTFQPQTVYPVGIAPTAVAMADLRGTGIADLIVTNSGDNSIGVLLGNGDGTFQPQATYSAGVAPVALATADFNADGHVDVVVANQGNATVSVLMGMGDGTLQPQVSYALQAGPVSVAVGDLDGDGLNDIVTSNSAQNIVSALLGKADGTFKTATTFSAGTLPYGVVAVDLNGDGLADIATVSNTAEGTITVLLSQHTESATANNFSLSNGSHSILASYSGDDDREPSQSQSVPLVGVPLVPTTISLGVSAPVVPAGQTITLTATVSPVPTSAPYGTVSFYSGNTLVGTAAVNSSGGATLTTGSLAAGSYSWTATYSGNGAFASSSSSAATALATIYTVSASQTPYTVVAGNSVTIPVNVSPLDGPFTNLVTMSATGLPPGAVASFSPAAVTPGASGTSTMMTIQTAAYTTLAANHGRHFSLATMAFAVGICVLATRKKAVCKQACLMLLTVLVLGSMFFSTACGGGFAGRPSHTYVITVTGTSGALHPSTTVTVVVK